MSARHLCLLVAGVSLGLGVASASADGHSRAKPRCGPAKAHTVKSSKYGRVFKRRGKVYGCSYSGGKPHFLGFKYDCGSSTACGGVNLVKLSGPWVGVGEFQSDGSTSVAWVSVLSLRTGRVLHRFREGGRSSDSNAFAHVQAIVLKTNGSIGWITSVEHVPRPPDEPPLTREVHRFDTTGHALLDTGPEIESLDRRESVMTWVNEGQAKSAPLK
jgi:hypothetical protein